MAFEVLKNIDTSYLDSIMLDNGLPKPVRWEKLKRVPNDHLKVWCLRNAVCQIPVQELIDWLRDAIGDKSAIEICAGRSCLGRPLGIPMTDSYFQVGAYAAPFYEAFQQPPIVPPNDVEKLTSNDAVKKYKPQVVVGAWVTQVGDGRDGASNPFGTDEEAILNTGAIYIHIGNLAPHGKKRILQRPHLEFAFPWLIGRGMDRSLNRIWVWNARQRS